MPYLDYNQSNGYLLPPYLEELIPADHVARVVNRVVDFRKNNIKALKNLFKQVVQICQKLGMVTLGLVAIDGTKVKAAASDYGAKTKDALREALKTVEADIERYISEGLAIDEAEDTLYGEDRPGQELPGKVKQALEKREAIVAAIKEIQEIKDKDKTGKKEPKLNPLEKEARFMKHSGGRINLSYNCQAAVDEKESVIVATDITSEANDKRQMLAMLENVEDLSEND